MAEVFSLEGHKAQANEFYMYCPECDFALTTVCLFDPSGTATVVSLACRDCEISYDVEQGVIQP